jgi:putative hydroxymethylpyrimidine transport system permease protein
MKVLFQGLFIVVALCLLWQGLVSIMHFPVYILPSPLQVLKSGYQHKGLLFYQAIPTVYETLLGFLLGIVFGCFTALLMAFFRPAKLWLLPILLISQALPTFAIAPILVIWLGYGVASKIATTILMLYFPITSSFYDGLTRTDTGWLDLAKTMNAQKWRTFWTIRIPAALPSLASGLRVAASIAPIGAIVGEWVGASHGLGYLMLNANARMQIDLMFAALFLIIIFSLLLFFVTDRLLKKWIFW